MKNVQWKDLFRGIKKSKGRYLSLLFIVALGTAFFAGVRSAEPDMIASADKYYDESGLMDVRILGTLGLTEEDVREIEKTNGITSAEGGYSTEVLGVFEDSKMVINVTSPCKNMNQMTIWEGRMPEAPDECFMDEIIMTTKGYEIGDTIKLTDENGNPPENLKTDTFTIVGSGTWSWYLSWSRGSASIGDGTMDAFMVVPEEAFDMDCYTVIYAMVNGARGMSTYSDAYDQAVETVTKRIKEISGERCEIRYAEIYEDAEQALIDAKAEVQSGEEKLADAEKKLEEGERAYQDGKAAYDKGLQAYRKGQEEAEKGKQQLLTSREQLDQGKEQYEAGVKEIEAAKLQIESAKEEIKSQEEKLLEGEKQLAQGKEQLQKAEEQFAVIEGKVNAEREKYLKKKAEYDQKYEAYEKEAAALRALEAQLSETQGQVSQTQSEIAGLEEALRQAEQEHGPASAEAMSLRAQLNEKKLQLSGFQAEVGRLKTECKKEEARLRPIKLALDLKYAELRLVEQGFQFVDGLMTTQKQVLQEKRAEVEAAEKKIADGKLQLEEAKKQIAENEKLLAEKTKELEAAKKALEDGEAEYRKGEEKLQKAEAELLAADKKLKSAQAELIQARKDLEDGWKKYKEEAGDANQKLQDAREQIAEGEKQLVELEEGKWYVLGRDTIQNSVEYGMDAKRIGAIGNVFPVIFFLVAALVSLTTMTRMIEEERTLIGTMKALGYSKLAIASKYILYAFSATLIGGIVGVIFGSKVLPFVIMQAYGMLYSNVQYMLTPLHWELCLLSIGMAMVCTVGAAMLACYKELMSTPASLMRPPAPKQGKRVFLERLTFIWNHLNFTTKSTVRNLIRYKKRFFMTVIGIGGCMAILLVSFGLSDSVAEIANNQYRNIWTYSALSGIEEQKLEKQKEEMKQIVEGHQNIKKAMLAKQVSMDVSAGDVEKNAQIYVIEDSQQMEDYLKLRERISKEKHELTDEGVILSEKLATILKVEEGDQISIHMSETESAEVPVTAVVENYISHYVYMTPKCYETAFGEVPEYNQMFFKFRENLSNEEEQEIAEYLLENDLVVSVTLVDEVQKTVDDMMNALNLVVWVLIISAGLLVFVVLFNLNNINISERRRELASLKVLGFSDMEVATYVYRENIILTLFGVLTGIFMGICLHKYLILTLEVDMIMFGRQIAPMSFVYSIILTILFAAVVNVGMFYKLRQIDMVESLKSVE